MTTNIRGLNMRKFANYMLCAGATLAIALHSVNSHADDASRAQLIQQLIQSQQGGKTGSIEEQVAKALLLQAQKLNPDVAQDKWAAIEGQVNTAVANMLAQGGGVIETTTRAGVANLSDADITHLISIYRDPVLVKYMSALSNPDIQAKAQQATMDSGLRVSELINSVLEKNGLQVAH